MCLDQTDASSSQPCVAGSVLTTQNTWPAWVYPFKACPGFWKDLLDTSCVTIQNYNLINR